MKNTDANDEGQLWHREDDSKVTTRQPAQFVRQQQHHATSHRLPSPHQHQRLGPCKHSEPKRWTRLGMVCSSFYYWIQVYY